MINSLPSCASLSLSLLPARARRRNERTRGRSPALLLASNTKKEAEQQAQRACVLSRDGRTTDQTNNQYTTSYTLSEKGEDRVKRRLQCIHRALPRVSQNERNVHYYLPTSSASVVGPHDSGNCRGPDRPLCERDSSSREQKTVASQTEAPATL